MIKIFYEAIDGYRKTKTFKTLAGARKYAWERVGEHPEMGSYYAVSADGVGKITANISLNELFPEREDPTDRLGGSGQALGDTRMGGTLDSDYFDETKEMHKADAMRPLTKRED